MPLYTQRAVVDELVTVAFSTDPDRELYDNATHQFHRLDDPLLPLRARFAPTAYGVLDLIRYRLLCSTCADWTDTAELPAEQRVFGQIDCGHCGAIVQQAGVVDHQVPSVEHTPEGADLTGRYPDGHYAPDYGREEDLRRRGHDDPDIHSLNDRFAPTTYGIWDLVTHQLLCRRCRQWTDSRRYPLPDRTLGRMFCQHCDSIIQP